MNIMENTITKRLINFSLCELHSFDIMEDHFRSVLTVPQNISKSSDKEPVRYIASNKFTGSKVGYYYSNGSKGLGYYLDPKQNLDGEIIDDVKKRKRDEDELESDTLALNETISSKKRKYFNFFIVMRTLCQSSL